MTTHQLNTILVATLASCVSHVEIEGAPCPCPDGFLCCETLGGCIDDAEPCPDTYPSSSRTPCARDSDCPAHEICQAWSVDGVPAGPGECGRDCSSGFPCAGGELCELALRDAAPLDDVSIARMCVDETPVAGCETAGCRDCDTDQLGQTFCEDKQVRACFLGLHPLCGLTCSNLVVLACGDAGCMDSGGGTCNSHPNGDPCLDFPCSACDPMGPGEYACDGTARVVGCVTAAHAGDSCNSICEPVSWECSPSECVEEGGARCAP